MKRAAAILAAAGLFGGCGDKGQSQAECLAAQVPAGLRTLPRILALANPPPERLEAGFVLCSTREGRLIAAAQALGAEGYSSYIGAGDPGKCLRVARSLEANSAAVEREVSTMCRIAAASRIVFVRWGAQVGGRTVAVRDGRLTMDGER